MTTQAPSQQSEDEDGVGFLARDDASRYVLRTSRTLTDFKDFNRHLQLVYALGHDLSYPVTRTCLFPLKF